MRVLAAVVVLLVSSVVAAQPGAQLQPYPPPPGYGYAPQPMQVQLTLDEQYLLERGYISDGQHVGGTVVAFFFGFGIGHAVQGRFTERGYLFAIGDAVAGAIMVNGMIKLSNCVLDSCTQAQEESMMKWLLVGTLSLSVVRIWEIVDAATGPTMHNRKLRDLHMRLGMRPMYTRLVPYVTPAQDSGAVAGVSLRF